MFDVLTIGTATRDIFLRSANFKVLRDKAHLEKIGFSTGEAECFALGSKIEVEKPLILSGGGVFNSAVTFARQGLKTASIFPLGNDENGKSIISDFKKEKIKTFPILGKSNVTAFSTILITPSGERTILVYRGSSEFLKKSDFQLSKTRSLWAYITPGHIPTHVMCEIVAELKKNKTKIAINPSKNYLNEKNKDVGKIFSCCDVVIMNKEEASFFTEIEYDKKDKIIKKLAHLIEGTIVMTDGENGAVVVSDSYIYRSSIFREKNVLDRTGAGDAFGSGFVSGIISGKGIHESLRFASANATSVIEQTGGNSGILTKKLFSDKRWKLLNLDVETL